MIRFATAAETPAVRQLWERCFPDESGFNEYFFGHIYRPETCLLLLEQNTLCAMTQMLPYDLRVEGQTYAATYIYGACTAPEERRHGWMTQVLQESFRLDQTMGRVASFLIPAEEWLFDFYRPFGYLPRFTIAEEQLQQDLSVQQDSIAPCTRADIPAMQRLYEAQTAAFPMTLLRRESDWRAQLDMFSAIGDGVWGLSQDGALCAYAFVWQTKDGLWLQECMADSLQHRRRLCNALLQQTGATHIRLTCPAVSGTGKRLGCIRWHMQPPSDAYGYLNLLLN